MKKRIIPRTPFLLKILKKYYIRYKDIEDIYRHSVAKLEAELRKELKEDTLELDAEAKCRGIYSTDLTMKRVEAETLENIK
jgi:hypothetical protein